MPQPTTSLATQRPDIAETFEEFDLLTSQQGFIGYKVLPIFDVAVQAGVYGKIPLKQLLQNADVKRNSKSGYNRIEWEFDDAVFSTKEYGLEGPVDQRQAKLYANYFDAEAVTGKIVRDRVLRAAEIRVANAVYNATTFSGQITSITNEWDSNHTSDATPIADVKTATNAVYDRTGIWPNTLVINRKVFDNLRLLDEIKDAITASGAGHAAKQSDINAAMLAQVFGVEQVLVAGGSQQNAENEGQPASLSEIWSSEYALVANINQSASFGEVGLGRTFHWSEDGSQPMGAVETYYEEAVRGDVVRVRHEVDEELIYPAVGQLLNNVTTI